MIPRSELVRNRQALEMFDTGNKYLKTQQCLGRWLFLIMYIAQWSTLLYSLDFIQKHKNITLLSRSFTTGSMLFAMQIL